MNEHETEPRRDSLVNHVANFVARQTGDATLARWSARVQAALERGHTAVPCDETLPENPYLVSLHGLCGFRRLYDQEKYLLEAFVSQHTRALADDTVQAVLQRAQTVWPDDARGAAQWQAASASLVNTRQLINGGPGTGKTTALIKLLLLHVLMAPETRVALAAPTGKAANRMRLSVQASLQQLADADMRARMQAFIPAQCHTLHRLLGHRPQDNSVAHDRDNPLPVDLLIVDESSMLDVNMFAALLQACDAGCHLVLLGDADQLPAVGSGQCFEHLCTAMQRLAQSDHSATPQVVTLHNNFRTAGRADLQALAGLVRSGDADGLRAFFAHSHARVQLHNPTTIEAQRARLHAVLQDTEEQDLMLLTPLNHGALGVQGLNRLMQWIKYRWSMHETRVRLAAHQPVMATANHHRLGVYNGDVGRMENIDGEWSVRFDERAPVPLQLLSQWMPAHAITIHKSQGSEYPTVVAVIPALDAQALVNRQLLYTAITRAQHRLELWSDVETLVKTVERVDARQTFLQIMAKNL